MGELIDLQDQTETFIQGGRLFWRVSPSTGLDRERFLKELTQAEKISERLGQDVHWYHNGVLVCSDLTRSGQDPWMWLTEANSLIAN